MHCTLKGRTSPAVCLIYFFMRRMSLIPAFLSSPLLSRPTFLISHRHSPNLVGLRNLPFLNVHDPQACPDSVEAIPAFDLSALSPSLPLAHTTSQPRLRTDVVRMATSSSTLHGDMLGSRVGIGCGHERRLWVPIRFLATWMHVGVGLLATNSTSITRIASLAGRLLQGGYERLGDGCHPQQGVNQ